ncbi:MAG: hypothetical protein HRU03_07300, partial [Nanoarchaeales archaeon]|nr:hypothetical protein [Nanoarchaeales archaeon]
KKEKKVLLNKIDLQLTTCRILISTILSYKTNHINVEGKNDGDWVLFAQNVSKGINMFNKFENTKFEYNSDKFEEIKKIGNNVNNFNLDKSGNSNLLGDLASQLMDYANFLTNEIRDF